MMTALHVYNSGSEELLFTTSCALGAQAAHNASAYALISLIIVRKQNSHS